MMIALHPFETMFNMLCDWLPENMQIEAVYQNVI